MISILVSFPRVYKHFRGKLYCALGIARPMLPNSSKEDLLEEGTACYSEDPNLVVNLYKDTRGNYYYTCDSDTPLEDNLVFYISLDYPRESWVRPVSSYYEYLDRRSYSELDLSTRRFEPLNISHNIVKITVDK